MVTSWYVPDAELAVVADDPGCHPVESHNDRPTVTALVADSTTAGTNPGVTGTASPAAAEPNPSTGAPVWIRSLTFAAMSAGMTPLTPAQISRVPAATAATPTPDSPGRGPAAALTMSATETGENLQSNQDAGAHPEQGLHVRLDERGHDQRPPVNASGFPPFG